MNSEKLEQLKDKNQQDLLDITTFQPSDAVNKSSDAVENPQATKVMAPCFEGGPPECPPGGCPCG